MKRNIYILISLILIASAVAGYYGYSHHCKQLLKEVDRYALPKVVEFMTALDGWNFEAVKPYLTEKYINTLSEEEWQTEFEQLAVLGELESFARPHFVSHKAYKRYQVCESAIDMYSVAGEFEKDNAVVRIFFENNCGKLKVASFIVTSRSIQVKPEYMEKLDKEGKDEKIIEELSGDEIKGDLDSMYQGNQDETSLPELDEETSKQVQKKLKESKNKPHGKAYRY